MTSCDWRVIKQKRGSATKLRIVTLRMAIAIAVAVPFANAEPQTAQELTIDVVYDAAARLGGNTFGTPLLISGSYSGQSQVYLKLESLRGNTY